MALISSPTELSCAPVQPGKSSSLYSGDLKLLLATQLKRLCQSNNKYYYGPHNQRRLPSKKYNRGENGREKEKSKIENDVIGLDDERGLGLQQVEGESWNDAIGRTNMPMKSQNHEDEEYNNILILFL